MCEWLSCREWSDVRLQCGGRSFAAHRAVLASVSAFLRRILLSCPTEDSPTFIVLPDFDLDAMSSVLYYIYNGEVVIQKQKFEMFMEIVKAMQIFVDEQYLPSTCKSYDNSTLWSKVEITSEKNKIFCLGDTTVGSYINLKKGDCADCTWLKKSYNDSEFGHKQIRCADWCKPTLENMESASGDRQKDFLRGLFIETYPQNGNANGRAAGVLAIQSARYRAPASVLPTNANSKHLRAGDTHEIHNISTDVPQFFTNSTPLRQNAINFNAQSGLSYSTEHAQIEKFHSVFSYFNPVDPMLENSNESKNQFIDRFSSYQSQGVMLDLMAGKPTLDLRDIKSHLNINHKTVSMSRLLDNTLKESQEDLDDSNINVIKHNRKIQYSNTIHSMFSKATVLNEVLDSPWRPRQPNNYRPFRRKLLNSSSTSENNVKECIINDNNNNVQTSPPLEVIERISATVSAVEPSYPIAELAVSNEFKCEICDQVFTNEEALSAHVRRHSSPARYSCTECSKSFSQLRNFKYHMSVHRGTREFAATCSVCGKYFNDRGYLSSHMKIHRNRKEYKCSQCPKSFNQRVAYNMHVRIHTGIKPHVCNECGKAFSRKMLLKQHQRTHSGERPYACSHCDKRFADRSNMTLHLRLHTGVKPFSCTLCPKSFTKKHHLKSHLNFHTGAKPYSCPKCKLAFTQSSNMRTHLKKCTAPDPTDNAESQSSS